jgi:hypothetical protein
LHNPIILQRLSKSKYRTWPENRLLGNLAPPLVEAESVGGQLYDTPTSRQLDLIHLSMSDSAMLHQATPSGLAEGAKKGQEEWKGGKSAHTSLDVLGHQSREGRPRSAS